MYMKSVLPLIVVLSAWVIAPAFAETGAVISYADGSGFIVVSDGVRSSYDITADDVIGLPIGIGDTILTDDATFVEIQLLAGSRGVVKLAENTTFTVTSLDEGGGGVFRVVYGRIRVRAATLAGGSRIWVTGHDTVAGVRGTDFGYDLFYDIAEEGGERQTAVYCFDGEVDVLQFDKETVSKADLIGAEPFVLGADRMVKTKSTEPEARLKAVAIDDEIKRFWTKYPLMTAAAAVPALGGEEELAVSEDLDLGAEEGTRKWQYENGGKILFTAGLGMMTAAGILRAVMPDKAADVSLGLAAVGSAVTATGGGLLVYSITLD